MAPNNSNHPSLTQQHKRVVFTENFVPSPDQVADISRYLLENMDREEMNPVALATGKKAKALDLIRQAINGGYIANIGKNPPESVLRGLYEHTLGLAAIENLLANPNVEQINLRGPNDIIVQTKGTWGKIEDPALFFRDEAEYLRVIENLVRRTGKELSPATRPIMDIRFDNPVLRIHVNQTSRGQNTSVFIRRGRSQPFTLEKLIKAGNLDREVANLFTEAAQRLIGCLFIGPVGTGKTVMLEVYIDSMPNVPIVVADDAGDCTPTHPFALINDLPGTTYSSFEQQVLTLGSMVKAALREGDVMAIAEIRGAEEAGIAISNAPSMRCVATTFHGDSPEAGLSRLVSLAQTPPSPYAGLDNSAALARDIANAFPLVIQMERSGNIRYISGIYHNKGRTNDGAWDLRPIVESVYDASGVITWEKVGDLDTVRRVRALDRIGRIQSTYEVSDPKQIYAKAIEALEVGNYIEAKHRLYQCLALSDTTTYRDQLIRVLELTGEAAETKQEAARTAQALQQLIERKDWRKAKKLIEEINQRPVRAFMRNVMPTYSQILQTIEAGERATEAAEETHVAASALLSSQARWDIAEMMADKIKQLDTSLVNADLGKSLHKIRIQLLDYLIASAPELSKPYFSQLRSQV